MTDEKTTPVEEEAQPQEPQQNKILLENLRVGYAVGLTQDNNFVFEIFGQERGLVELLGIHSHASKQVNRAYDNTQLGGDRLVHEVGKAVQMVNQKLDQLISLVTPPKKSDNELP